MAEDADDEVLGFLYLELAHPLVVTAVLQRAALNGSFLVSISSGLAPDLQELLRLRQEDICSHPEIFDHLEENPELSRYSRRWITEYREHLLPREQPVERERAKEEATKEESAEALPDPEVQRAVTEAAAEVPADGEVDDQTGLSEVQIRSLPVGIRVKLTFGAPKSLRGILLRDHNPQVAVAALTNGSISGSEIDELAAQRNVVQEVLSMIALNPCWVRRYGTLSALVRNPRTSEGLSQRLLPRLTVRDLRYVFNDVGLSQAVRLQAKRIFSAKTG